MIKSAGITFLLAITLISVMTNCDSTITNERQFNEQIIRPDHESWDVKITVTSFGKRRAEIKADHLEKFNDKNVISLDKNVIVDFYDSEGKHTSRLTAEKTEINERNNFLQAIGNVVAKSDSGVTLYSDTLTWDDTNKKIFAPGYVMITTANQDTLYGNGFESDLNIERWKILNPHGVANR